MTTSADYWEVVDESVIRWIGRHKDLERLRETIRSTAEALWTFEWSRFPDGFNAIIDLMDYPEGRKPSLVFEVWVRNSDDLEDEVMHPLMFWSPLDSGASGQDSIRSTIQAWVAHETDEQLIFDGERPYYPHIERVRP